jgi:hypothetical protein
LRVRLSIIAIAAAVLIAGAGKVSSPPSGWREPTSHEAADLLREARKSVGLPSMKQNLSIRADFDGDGRSDRAIFLLNDRLGEFALFVVRARTGRYERLDYNGKRADLYNYGLDVERPGRREAACARGLGDDSAPCRRSIRLRWPGIGVSHFEASYEVFFWDGQRFDSELLSD